MSQDVPLDRRPQTGPAAGPQPPPPSGGTPQATRSGGVRWPALCTRAEEACQAGGMGEPSDRRSRPVVPGSQVVLRARVDHDYEHEKTCGARTTQSQAHGAFPGPKRTSSSAPPTPCRWISDWKLQGTGRRHSPPPAPGRRGMHASALLAGRILGLRRDP